MIILIKPGVSTKHCRDDKAEKKKKKRLLLI